MTIRKLFIPTICSALVFVGTAISMDASPTGIRQNCAPQSRIADRRSNAAIMDLLRPGMHYSKYLPKPGLGNPGDDLSPTYYLLPNLSVKCQLVCLALMDLYAVSPDPIPFRTEGSGTFRTISNSLEGPVSTQFRPVSYEGNSTSNDPLLGDISWSFDLTRDAQNTTITANSADADFPATADMYVYITGTLSVTPDITYRSQRPVHFTNPNLSTFNPQVNERWSLAEQVPFEDVNNPGVTVLTLLSADATFN